MNESPFRRPKQTAGDPPSQIDRLLADGFQVKEAAFGRVALFLVDDLDTLQPGFVGDHLDKAGVRKLDKVLVVPVAQIGYLLPEVIFADD